LQSNSQGLQQAICMKIVFHEDFKCTDYASNGASVPGRMEVIITALVKEGRYEVVSPEPALYEDLARAHSRTHIADIAKDARLFKMASLAAGGAILASEIAFKGKPTFACIRPPGIRVTWDRYARETNF